MKIHFVGIGGMGMSPIAEIAEAQGYEVSGSDIKESTRLQKLRSLGVKIFIGNQPENLNLKPDLVIRSSGVALDNPEIQTARNLNIPVIKRSEMLGKLVQKNRYPIGIAGTHGKSTTATLTGCILKEAGLDPIVMVGAWSKNFQGHALCGQGDYFIAEADEFDRSFLDFDHLYAAVITNIEFNHMDYFRDCDDMLSAFGDFLGLINNTGFLVAGYDSYLLRHLLAEHSPNCKLITYGFGETCDWQPVNIRCQNASMRFDICYQDTIWKNFSLSLPRVYIINSIAALALSQQLGVDVYLARNVMQEYQGLKRRFETKQLSDDIILIDDYANHPTKIRVTLEGARELYRDRRIWTVFQSRQYRRTKILLDDFINSFNAADKIIISDISAGLGDGPQEKASVHALDLVRGIERLGLDIQYIPNLHDIVDFLALSIRPGDVVITIGTAYEIGEANEELRRRLK